MTDKQNWSPDDWVIMIFSVTISIILLGVMFRVLVTGTIMTPENAKLFTGTVVSIIAIISIWVGRKLK